VKLRAESTVFDNADALPEFKDPRKRVENYNHNVFRGWVPFLKFLRTWSLIDFGLLLLSLCIFVAQNYMKLEFLVGLPLEQPLLAKYVGENLEGNKIFRKKTALVGGKQVEVRSKKKRIVLLVFMCECLEQVCELVDPALRSTSSGLEANACTTTYYSDTIRARKVATNKTNIAVFL
jgi:hypothetical protein